MYNSFVIPATKITLHLFISSIFFLSIYFPLIYLFTLCSLGCVEFGPEVTSSDKSVKVMLNSQDKVDGTKNVAHLRSLLNTLYIDSVV